METAFSSWSSVRDADKLQLLATIYVEHCNSLGDEYSVLGREEALCIQCCDRTLETIASWCWIDVLWTASFDAACRLAVSSFSLSIGVFAKNVIIKFRLDEDLRRQHAEW